MSQRSAWALLTIGFAFAMVIGVSISRARHHCEVMAVLDIIREPSYRVLPEVRETIERHNAKVRWVCWGIPTIPESP